MKSNMFSQVLWVTRTLFFKVLKLWLQKYIKQNRRLLTQCIKGYSVCSKYPAQTSSPAIYFVRNDVTAGIIENLVTSENANDNFLNSVRFLLRKSEGVGAFCSKNAVI